MPHSVSPPSSPHNEDTDMLDAVTEQPSAQTTTQSDSSSDEETGEPTSSLPLPTNDVNPTRTNLEDMFDDDDDDYNNMVTSSDAAPIRPSHSASYSDPEVMRAFYQRLFPFRYLFQWLNHSPTPTNDFAHREFSFTLQNEVYLRYQSFASADLLRKQCIAQLPSRFEVGPVYSTNPRDRKTLRRAAAFRPVSKELVFDIDMDAYDEIRTCCTGSNICHRCWCFIKMAIKVVNTTLEEDFGFKHVLWVYSGRRGAHAWVCDKKARELEDSKRKAIANYLDLVKGGDSAGKKVNLKRPLHPHIERSLNLLREHFAADILHDQDPWQTPEKAAKLLSFIPDTQLATSLAKKWEAAPDRLSTNKWTDIDALASSGGGSATLDPKKLKEAKQDIVLEYTYPRLDAEVSKKLNHLLKSPFCVHPKTGRICVPIDPRHVDAFDPFEVPTVTELLGQIDTWDDDHRGQNIGVEAEADGKKMQDWEKTRLKPYIEYFRSFVTGLLREEQGGKRRREDGVDAMEF